MSSTKTKVKFSADIAMLIAAPILEKLYPYCERLAIAGSLRRQCEYVSDIEICCIPKMVSHVNMFGVETSTTSMLEEHDSPTLGRFIKNGAKYKQIELPEGINLDLFIITPPAEWGVIMAIRTGPADYSRWLVTKTPYGAMPLGCSVKDGCVYRGEDRISMPEEKDFLNFLGIAWIEPSQRTLKWKKENRTTAASAVAA